ncbi:hypothetical protein [Chryseobacterium sp. Leaf394]|uniref:hypothetical protein n=1 Tax=Chryseobacterium sp. Leaf394 TaxID=1736361 RepID=UPI0006FE36F2|nr:hypothetical protein [Chryseobacterium sp. Leaf394]KQS94367.1 hypothetical protein ASG21_19275 [Chryseobacterium sp. Leaf394]
MKNITLPVLSLAFIALSVTANAQVDTKTDSHTIGIGIPEVALLDIEPSATKNITMGFEAPTEAGLPITPPADNTSLWLNYSSIKAATAPDNVRAVSVKLNALIPGVDIKVTAAAKAGVGSGTFGIPSAQLTLTAADQNILTGIGSAFTGNGATNGHNLTYNVNYGNAVGSTANYADLVASTATATVTYTISDN